MENLIKKGGSGGGTAQPSDVKSGMTFTNDDGFQTGTFVSSATWKGNTSINASSNSLTVPSGNYLVIAQSYYGSSGGANIYKYIGGTLTRIAQINSGNFCGSVGSTVTSGNVKFTIASNSANAWQSMYVIEID